MEDVFGAADAAFEKGPRYCGDTLWSDHHPGELMSNVRERVLSAPSGCTVDFEWLPPVQRDSPPLDMAFSMKGSTYVHAHAIWKDAAQDDEKQGWVRAMMAGFEPFKVGYYVGEADLTAAPDRAKQCFSPEAWDKLLRLKRTYDPNDVFFSYLQEPDPAR